MAQARRITGEGGAVIRKSADTAEARAVAAAVINDRRARSDGPRPADPITLRKSVIGLMNYPPAAAASLVVIQALLVLAIGRLTEWALGLAAAEPEYGPHGLIIIVAAFLYPLAAIFQHSFDRRAESLAALWGIRLIAPLAVAQLIAIALFAALFPSLTPAESETLLVDWIGAWFIANLVTIGLVSAGFELLIRHWEAAGRLARRVVVFGGSGHGQRFIESLAGQPVQYLRVGAFFDDRSKGIPDRIAGVPYSGDSDALIAYVQRERIDEIFIALPWSAKERILDILRKCRPLPMPVRLAPDNPLLLSENSRGEAQAALIPIVRQPPLSPWGQFLKSAFDRTVAALGLILVSPLLAVIAAAIKLTSRGPVFFRQPRLGFNNRPFTVFKFRTMRVTDNAAETVKQATRCDPRRTAIGAFLRRWSLDELPQLINVVRGEMSLVGPRPHPIWRRASDLWDQGGNQPLEAIIHEYAARHRVKPGITGLAQVSGYRGETATVERMLKRVEFDLYYIDHWSLWFDIGILLRTALALFKSENAY